MVAIRSASGPLALIALVVAVLTSVYVTPVASPAAAPLPLFRYVNSGWVSPLEFADSGPFTQELRAFVITSQQELDAYNAGIITKRTLGSTVSLGRIEFEESILLAAYYAWRVVQGDPLSVASLEIEGGRAVVDLELSDDPQGRERPYLFAPVIMVAVERALFPPSQEVEFVFNLNGQPVQTEIAVPN